MQKKHIDYAQSKGSLGGINLPYMIAKNAVANYYIEELEDDFPVNIPLHPDASLLRISAIGGPVFVKFGSSVIKESAEHAKSTLTLAVNPVDLDDDNFTIGEQEYVYKSEIERKAQATLALTGTITPGVHAKSILTLDGDIIAGTEVSIGTRDYVYVEGSPENEGEVSLGLDDEGSLANLKNMINLGDNLTTPHDDVVATASDATTLTIKAKSPGVWANDIDLDATDDLTWDGVKMGEEEAGVDGEKVELNGQEYEIVEELSEDFADAIPNQILYGDNEASALDNLKLGVNKGTGEGTNYSTGTVANTALVADTNTDTTQVFVAKIAGEAGNEITVSTDMANGGFGEGVETLEGGYDDDGKTIVIGENVGATQDNTRVAVNGGDGAGTVYSAGLLANPDAWMDEFDEADGADVIARKVGTDGNDIPTLDSFDSASNGFDVAKTAGGDNGGSYDALIPAGEVYEYGIDGELTVVSLQSDNSATTGVAMVEY